MKTGFGVALGDATGVGALVAVAATVGVTVTTGVFDSASAVGVTGCDADVLVGD